MPDELDDLIAGVPAAAVKIPKKRQDLDYRALYQDVGKKYDVDPDLLYNQAKHESVDFNPHYVYGPGRSPKGAAGIAQFMPSTARQYGLYVGKGRDDRFDPVKSADAHARLMKDLIGRYGDPQLALAAYNSGTEKTAAQARRAMQRIPETRNYVQKIAPTQDELDDLVKKLPSASGRSYETALSPDEERQFSAWRQQYAPKDSGTDYDLRGAFKAGLKPDPRTGHWPDTFKKPNHPTFSNQSQYATGENAAKAGRWQGEQFIPAQQAAPQVAAPQVPVDQGDELDALLANLPQAKPTQQSQPSSVEPGTPVARAAFKSRVEGGTGGSGLGQLKQLDEAALQGQQARDAAIRQETQREFDSSLNPVAIGMRLGAKLRGRPIDVSSEANARIAQQRQREQDEPEVQKLTSQYRAMLREIGAQTGEQWSAETGMRGTAGLVELVAGILKASGLGLLPENEKVNAIQRHAAALQRAATEEGANRNAASQFAQEVLGGAISTAPELAAMSVGIPAAVAFGAGGGLRAAGRGETPVQAAREVGKQAAIGVGFGAQPLGQGAATKAITKGLQTGAATTGIELAGGTPLKESLAAGATMGVMAGAPEFLHLQFGRVKATESQVGVPKGEVRVVDEAGTEHVIQRPTGTGAGNQRAIPVKPIAEAAAEVPTERRGPDRIAESDWLKYTPEERAATRRQLDAEQAAGGPPEAGPSPLLDDAEYRRRFGVEPPQPKGGIPREPDALEGSATLERPVSNLSDISTAKAEETATSPLSTEAGSAPQPSPVSEPPPPSTTSARKAQMAEDAAALDLPELPPAERKSWQASLDNAKSKGLDERAETIAKEVIEKPRPLNDEETAGLVLAAQRVKNAHNELTRQLAESEGSPSQRMELEALEHRFDRLREAARASGSEKGRTLAAQKLTINQDYDLVSLLNRYKVKTGKEPTAEIRKQIEQQATRIGELEGRLAEREQKITELQTQKGVDKLAREERTRQRKQSVESLDAEAAELRQLIAQEWKKTQTGVQPSGLAALDPEGAITKLVLKLARNRVKAGVTKAADIVDAVHEMIKDAVDIDKRDIAKMISGYGHPAGQPRSDIQQQLDTAKAELRRVLKEEDVAAGTRTAKRQGPPQAKRAIVSRIEKRIAEYERKIKEEDFSKKPARPETVLDPETAKVKLELDRKKAEYERLVDRKSAGWRFRIATGLRKAWMLSGLSTQAKNTLGTGGYQSFDEISRLPASIVDAALASHSGFRGIEGVSPSHMLDSVIHGAKVGGREALETLRYGAPKEQLEKLQVSEINTGIKAIDVASNMVFRIMSASDRLFYQQAYQRNLLDRSSIQARNEARADPSIKVRERAKEIADEPTPQLDADAKHDALIATFNNNNTLSDTLKSFRATLHSRLGPEGGAAANAAIDLVIPFDRTPTNVIARILEASPLGAFKAATGGYKKSPIKIARSIIDRTMTQEEQRQFSQTMGRATAGTALMSFGFYLASKGLVTVNDYGDAFLNAGGQKWNIAALSPVGAILAVGANAYRSYTAESKSKRKYGAMIKPLADAPQLRGPSAIGDIVKDPERNLPKFLGNTAATLVPFSGAVRDVAKTVDWGKERKAVGFTQQIQKNIPFWRQGLPERREKTVRQEKTEQLRKGQISDADLDVDESLTKADRAAIKKDAQGTEFQASFRKAIPSQALDRFERMNASQRADVEEIMSEKAASLVNSDSLTETQKEAFRVRLEKLGIEPKVTRPHRATTDFMRRYQSTTSP